MITSMGNKIRAQRLFVFFLISYDLRTCLHRMVFLLRRGTAWPRGAKVKQRERATETERRASFIIDRLRGDESNISHFTLTFFGRQ